MVVQPLPRLGAGRHALWRAVFVALHAVGLAAAYAIAPHELRALIGGLLGLILVVGLVAPVRDVAAALPALSPLIAFVAMVAECTCACPQHAPEGPWPFLAVIAVMVVGDSVIALAAPARAEASLPGARTC